MKFNDMDKRMRIFETGSDICVLPEIYMVARLDGRSFTKLTKEVHSFEAPFDEKFRDHMLGVTEHLIDVGFKVVYGYTENFCFTGMIRHSGRSSARSYQFWLEKRAQR